MIWKEPDQVVEITPRILLPQLPPFWMLAIGCRTNDVQEMFVAADSGDLLQLETEAVEVLGLKSGEKLGNDVPFTFGDREEAIAAAAYVHSKRPHLFVSAISNDPTEPRGIPAGMLEAFGLTGASA